jgi:hypothetical protein
MDNTNEYGVSTRITDDFATTIVRNSLAVRRPRHMTTPLIHPDTGATSRIYNIPSELDTTYADSIFGMSANNDDYTVEEILESRYTVPSSVFAESCPACDEMAMDFIDPSFAPRYPKGWELVACRRHAGALKSSADERQVLVGGVPETRKNCAMRYYARRMTQEVEKAAEKRAAAAAVESSSSTCTDTPSAVESISTRAHTPSAPPSSPDISGTTTPTTTTAETDPCPICVEDKPNLTLDCGHSFCNPCLTTWQQGFSDEKLIAWVNSSSLILRCYPILSANLKSRFTCPMCRTYLQHTQQSRRKRKMHNQMLRGEDWTENSARVRRGGVGGRTSRARRRMEMEEAEDICDEATFRMPVVYRD